MNYLGVIFDFNGTLFFDAKFHEAAWSQLINEIRGKPLSNQEMTNCIHGAPNIEALEALFPNQYSVEEKNILSMKKEELYRQRCNQVPSLELVSGSKEFFEILIKNSVAMTIASASILENINYFIERFKLGKWFNTNKIVYDNGCYTNKEKMFEDALKLLSIRKEDCLIFEDSKSGIESAIKAGFTSIIGLYEKEVPSYFKEHKEIIYSATNYKEIMTFLELKKEG